MFSWLKTWKVPWLKCQNCFKLLNKMTSKVMHDHPSFCCMFPSIQIINQIHRHVLKVAKLHSPLCFTTKKLAPLLYSHFWLPYDPLTLAKLTSCQTYFNLKLYAKLKPVSFLDTRQIYQRSLRKLQGLSNKLVTDGSWKNICITNCF